MRRLKRKTTKMLTKHVLCIADVVIFPSWMYARLVSSCIYLSFVPCTWFRVERNDLFLCFPLARDHIARLEIPPHHRNPVIEFLSIDKMTWWISGVWLEARTFGKINHRPTAARRLDCTRRLPARSCTFSSSYIAAMMMPVSVDNFNILLRATDRLDL